MEKGTVTLSFDDGRKDTYHVFKNILEPMNLPAVVYIPSGYIEIGYDNYLEIGHNGLMSKSELDYIQKNFLFEVAGHGYMHKNDFNDIQMGVDKLREWYPDIKEIGLASPHSEINKSYVEKNIVNFKKMGFSYVRGGRNFERYMSVKRMISLLARKTKSKFIFCQCYKNSTNVEDSYYLHAIPIHKLTSLNQIKGIIDYCVKNKKWAILEFHGIDKKDSKEYTEEFCWLEDDFIELCKYINELRSKEMLYVKNPLKIVRGNSNNG